MGKATFISKGVKELFQSSTVRKYDLGHLFCSSFGAPEMHCKQGALRMPGPQFASRELPKCHVQFLAPGEDPAGKQVGMRPAGAQGQRQNLADKTVGFKAFLPLSPSLLNYPALLLLMGKPHVIMNML